jgi:alpha-tubulin suppressor-like RCC1 family protein
VTIERYAAYHVYNSTLTPNTNLLKDPTPRPIQLVDGTPQLHWRSLAAGENHGLVLSVGGEVYTWGLGIYGELGKTSKELAECQTRLLGSERHLTIETQRYRFDDKTLEDYRTLIEDYAYDTLQVPMLPAAHKLTGLQVITQVACGQFHSLLLSSSSTVYAFGLGLNGRLGHGSGENCSTPQVITALSGVSVTEVAAGYNSSFFLTSQATLLSCGCASSSGHPSDTFQPQQISFLEDVHSISSALNHSGVVTNQGQVVLFGDNSHGKVCGASPCFLDPALIGGRRARAVHCGAKYTMFLTEDLEVYAVGCNDKGQLGLSSTNFNSVNQPIHVDFLSGRGVCELSLGQEHSTAITVNGLLYTWGSNREGQLGIGTMAKEFKRVGLPRLNDAFLGSPVTLVRATRGCTFFLTAAQHPELHSSLFWQWKRSLIQEEKVIQERSNYRYCLLKRELDRQDLVKRIRDERDAAQGAVRAPAVVLKAPKKQTEDDYYCFWREENESESMVNGRVVVKLKKPRYFNDKRPCTVTVFPPRKPSTLPPTATGAPDISSTLNISTESGSVAVNARLTSGHPEKTMRPLYYERLLYEPKYRHTPSLLTPHLFYPYDLVPNPVLIEPLRRA